MIKSITRLHLEGEYKEVVGLSTRILPIIASSTENSLKIRYLRALALVALEDCSGLKELFELRKSSYRGYFEQMLLGSVDKKQGREEKSGSLTKWI